MKDNFISKKNWKTFNSFYILSIKAFFYSPLNVFLGIGLIFFILYMWLLFRTEDRFILASAIGTLIIRNGVHTFYRTLSMHKRTGYSMRINYSSAHFLYKPLAQILASLTINFITSVLLILFTITLFKEQRELILNVNWKMFISSMFLLWFLCILITYSIFYYIESQTAGQIIAILIYIFAFNLLGCAFPYDVIAEYEWINFILYFFPLRYMMNVAQAGWVNAPNLIYEEPGYILDFQLWEKLWIPYVITICWILLLSIILLTVIIKRVNKYKKDDFGTNLIIKLSSKYIRQIKRASSIEELNNLRKEHLENKGYSIKLVNNLERQKEITNEPKNN